MIQIFLEKWGEYLHKIKMGQKLLDVMGKDFETVEDVKRHMEEIRIYMRGHNLYDILESIERFIYFESRKK